MNMKGKIKGSAVKALRFLPLIFILIFAGLLIASPKISVQTLLSYTPKSHAAAAVALLALYAFKSATVFIPLILLQITAGHLFSPGIALIINFIGMIITLTVPYWIGRFAGMNTVRKLTDRYPKLGRLSNSRFLCFFLRIISCFPGDIVTMYLGAAKTPFARNLIFGLLGVMPGMILSTLIGESILDIGSPMFWISVGLTVILSAASAVLYYIYTRKLKKKTTADMQ